MSAPVLLLLARGGEAGEQCRSADEIRSAIQTERPDLDVRLAHGHRCLPSITQTVKHIVKAGRREVIVVGLGLTEHPDDPQGPAAVARRIDAQYSQLSVSAGRSLAPDATLLRVIDARLREALTRARSTELDALVLAAAHHGDSRAQGQLARIARQWSNHHKLPVVISYESGHGPGVTSAIRSLRATGRRHIGVGSWFLTAGEMWQQARDAAVTAGVEAVADPVGAVEETVRLLLSRYAFAAMDLLTFDDEPVSEVDPLAADELAEVSRPRHLSVVSA